MEPSSRFENLEIAFFDTASYSNKKHQNSLSKLLGVSPQGKILFISKSFFGINNDDYIAEKTKAEWYEKLTDHEWVIADSGFRGLEARGWRVLTPSSDEQFYRLHSSKRIIVENVFSRIKLWALCRDKTSSFSDGGHSVISPYDLGCYLWFK